MHSVTLVWRVALTSSFRSAKEASKRDPSLPSKLASEENRAGGKSHADARDIMQKNKNKLKRPYALQQELDNSHEGSLSSYLDHMA